MCIRRSSELPSVAGKDEVLSASTVVGVDSEVNMAPVPCRSPMVPSSVLSVLNFNEMNKRSVNRDVIEEPWSRKCYGIRGVLWTRCTLQGHSKWARERPSRMQKSGFVIHL